MDQKSVFEHALAHHQKGQLAEAEQLYLSILNLEPGHPDTNHNLGLIALQRSQPSLGLPYLQRAWEADPSVGQYWLSLTECLLEAGHPEDALMLIENAINRGLQTPQSAQLQARAKSMLAEIQAASEVANEVASEVAKTTAAPSPTQPGNANQENAETPRADKAIVAAREREELANLTTHTKKFPDAQERGALSALYSECRYAEAANFARAMTLKYPLDAFCWKMLGAALMEMGNPSDRTDTLAALQKAVELAPKDAAAHNNLGVFLQLQGDLKAAKECLRKAIKISPGYANAHNSLGSVLDDLGQSDAARLSYLQALKFNPKFADAHNNLGSSLRAKGRLDAAAASLKRALAINPDHVEALSNMGVVLNEMKLFDEALGYCQRSLALKPNSALALCALGNVLKNQGHLVAAAESLQSATELKPEDVRAWESLGSVLNSLGALDRAETAYRRVLSLDPGNASAHNNLGTLLRRLGQLDAAQECFRHALKMDPKFSNAHSNLLFCLTHDQGIAPHALFAEHCLFGQRFPAPKQNKARQPRNVREPGRRLRIGYFSPDFRRHAVSYFAEPLFANHDKSQVEVFCYAEVAQEDDYTARIRQCADHWHPTVQRSDEELAQLIQSHEIDILVDLAGHTASNRLPVFAKKPAPIQMTYLGYPGTTGLSTVDYRITDHCTDPEGAADAVYTEKLLRLPGSMWCYRPTGEMPDVSALPALARGYVTFGSFNSFSKVDQPTISLWADLLQALPTSRLMMLTVPEGKPRQDLVQKFAESGIDASRLEFHGPLSTDEFLRKFAEIDISLDPLRVNGATTTCESLWMGVPVISLAGQRFLSRAGLSILSAAGVGEFVAASPADYVRIARDFSENLPALAESRAGLRRRVAASRLADGSAFARDIEHLYREAWKTWCATC